jgi:hypothetical protein
LDTHSPEGSEPEGVLNELSFEVRSRIEAEDDLAPEDCTAAVFDIDAKMLKLA